MIQLWRCRDHLFEIGSRALVMGIVNVTPDSFSDGGRFESTAAAVDQALRLVDEGADILDIGGESSRPGAQPVSLDEELARVIPVVREVSRRTPIAISVDTVKAAVAREAILAGACIINDITGLSGDREMAETVRATGAGLVLMHMRGEPRTMQQNPVYSDVVAEVGAFFEERLAFAGDRGIDPAAIVLDPGIGFGKTQSHNLELLRRLNEFQRFGRPVCIGVSRKGFIGQILGRPLDQRLAGSLSVACHAIEQGNARILRVHDVAAHRDAVVMLEAIHPGRELTK
jgi:dihydropteroate synthase